MLRENNEAMCRFWDDPKGAKQAALCCVALVRRRPTMPSSVRLAENGLLNAALGNITEGVLGMIASGDRVDVLKKIKAPTLVIHGKADKLALVEGGIDTARLIRNARLELIDGMGHDLPQPLLARFVELITSHAVNVLLKPNA